MKAGDGCTCRSSPADFGDCLITALMLAKGGEKVGSVIAQAQEAKPLAEPHRPKKGEKVDNRNLSSGTSANYLTRRIARDHPDILERMKAGELSRTRR